LESGDDATAIANKLVQQALDDGSEDNTTAVVAVLS
jgi:serine/threonine protein phosphatase PrpC